MQTFAKWVMHVQTVLVDTSWLYNVWEMFLLLMKFKFFFRENGVSKKIKAHFVQNPPPLQQLFSPHLLNFIQKKLASLPFKVEGAESMYSISIWDITKDRQ